MNKDVVRCVVLSHDDGPSCPACGTSMDTAKAVEQGSGLDGMLVCYCYSCLINQPEESVICLLKNS